MRFEIKKTEYVNRTFRIPKNLADKLSKTAQKENVSTNEFVVQAVEYAISSLEEYEQAKRT